MSDPVTAYDAFAAVVRQQTAAIHEAVRAFPDESWITPERTKRAQQIANRLQEVINEFDLEGVKQ